MLTHTVHGGCFVNDDFFNQRIQKLRCQFGGVSILLDKRNPCLRIDSSLFFRFKLCRQPFDFLDKLLLLGLIFLRYHVEVVFRNATIRSVLVQLRKLAVNLCSAFLGSYKLYTLPFGSSGNLFSLPFSKRCRSAFLSNCASLDNSCILIRT